MAAAAATTAPSAERHVHLTPLQSLRANPDRFLGSCEVDTVRVPVPAPGGVGVAFVDVTCSPALRTTLKEMLDNAVDQVAVDEALTCIKAGYADGVCYLENNGRGMSTAPAVYRATDGGRNLRVAEACASVFDYTSKTAAEAPGDGDAGAPAASTGRSVDGLAGKNGVGMKGVNGTAAAFKLHTVDAQRKESVTVEWAHGMSRVTKRAVRTSKGAGTTRFTWTPDVAFLVRGADPAAVDVGTLWRSMVWCRAALLQDKDAAPRRVACKWADARSPTGAWAFAAVPWKTPAALLAPAPGADGTDDAAAGGTFTVAWGSAARVVCRVVPPDDAHAGAVFGFVNGMPCNAGTHVSKAWAVLRDAVARAWPSGAGTPAYTPKFATAVRMAKCTALLVTARVAAPTFTSQDKGELGTPVTAYWPAGGAASTKGAKVAAALARTLARKAADDAEVTALRAANRDAASAAVVAQGVGGDGAASSAAASARRSVVNVKNYTPATLAGGKRRNECVLLLAEGASAKNYCLTLRAAVPGGSGTMGVYALKGKPMNARKEGVASAAKNTELAGLAAILGLKWGAPRPASGLAALRYSSIWVAADMDSDGNHIFGLVYSNVAALWPWIHGADPVYVKRYTTPLLRTTPGSGGPTATFHSQAAADAWLASLPPPQRARVSLQHVKGLGQWRRQDIITLHAPQLASNVLDVRHSGAGTDAWLNAAFRDAAQDRRDLMAAYDPTAQLDYSAPCVTFEEWAAVEMVAHMWAHVERNVPRVTDGMCPTQRKVVYVMLQRAVGKPVRTDTAAADVIKSTLYAHGEASIQNTTAGLAASACGKANVPVLLDQGAFGTRFSPSPASHRYTYTGCSELTAALFPRGFLPLLPRVVEDGHVLEAAELPCPLPFVLLNGRTTAIGTGYSSVVLPVHWRTLAQCVRQHLDADDGAPAPWSALNDATPCFDGVRVAPVVNGPVVTMRGAVRVAGAGVLHITDLPPGKWTGAYVESLKAKAKAGTPLRGGLRVHGVQDASTDELVSVLVFVDDGTLAPLTRKTAPAAGTVPAELSSLPPAHMDADDGGSSAVTYPDLEAALGLVTTMRRDNVHFIQGGVPGDATSAAVVRFSSVAEYVAAWAARTRAWYARRRAWDLIHARRRRIKQANVLRFIVETRAGFKKGVYPAGAFTRAELDAFTSTPLPPLRSLKEAGALESALGAAGYAPDAAVRKLPTPRTDTAQDDMDAYAAAVTRAQSDDDATYEYLVHTPIAQQSAAAVDAAVRKLAACRASEDAAAAADPTRVWLQDLSALEDALERYTADRRDMLSKTSCQEDRAASKRAKRT